MRITQAFKKGKAFIPFITCGDPNLETTEKLIQVLAENGADAIELGIPFSDPTAEGEIIQKASARALATGITVDKIFNMLENVKVEIPLAFMTYANVVYFYGIENFCKKCVQVGISAIILPDIPYEEKDEFTKICEKHDIDFISFIAPTSDERIAMIAKEATGFIYCVSSLGVTGVRSNIVADIPAMVKSAKSVTGVPIAVGFGISTPEQAKEMSKKADGVIIGSAIVKIIAEHGENCLTHVAEYATSIKNSLSQ